MSFPSLACIGEGKFYEQFYQRPYVRLAFQGFFQATQGGDMTPLMDLLSEEVTLLADGGGKSKQLRCVRLLGVMRCRALAWERCAFCHGT